MCSRAGSRSSTSRRHCGEPLTGNVVTGNVIEQESIDVAVRTTAQINVHLNDLGGGGVGVANLGTGAIDATMNWWGCAHGPTAHGCSSVQDAVTYAPWLTKSVNESDQHDNGRDR